MSTVNLLLRHARERLAAAGVASPELVATPILAEVLGVPKERLRLDTDRDVPAADAARFDALVRAREQRRPLAQLLRRAEFWSLDFLVTPGVLSPRPETEALVEIGAAALRASACAHPVAVDLGTGTACIAIALAREVPRAVVHATDVSADALEVATINVRRHGLESRVHLHHGDLLAPLAAVVEPGSVDVVVSNPPYVRRSEAGEVDAEVLWEPAVAVFCDREPHELYARIAADAAPYVATGGVLALELPGHGSDPVIAAVSAVAGWHDVRVLPDLAGLPRILRATRA